MPSVRQPAVAGGFYPADPGELRAVVDGHLQAARDGAVPGQVADAISPDEGAGGTTGRHTALRAVIAPHAGYVYSGSTAALAYRLIAERADQIRRVVLLGPCHQVAVRGLALPGVEALATPLGEVPVDGDLARQAAELPQVIDSPQAHAHEHSLEVHLPFLQRVLPSGFSVLPLAVGHAPATDIAEVLASTVTSPDTLLVVSSDLSHYHPYDEAVAVDRATCEQILRLEQPLHPEQACGAFPVSGLLAHARTESWRARLLGRCTSGDTAGDRRRVVGYASLAFLAVSGS